MRRREQASDAREALVRWLEVLEVYLRINLSTVHGQQYRQLSLNQDPIGILRSSIMDLDRGVVPWIMKGCERSSRAHDLRAVEFKARCVVLADEIGDERAYKLGRDAAAGYGVKMSGKAQIKEWRRQMRDQPDGAMASDAKIFRSEVADLRADKASDDIVVEMLLAGDQYFPTAASPKVG